MAAIQYAIPESQNLRPREGLSQLRVYAAFMVNFEGGSVLRFAGQFWRVVIGGDRFITLGLKRGDIGMKPCRTWRERRLTARRQHEPDRNQTPNKRS